MIATEDRARVRTHLEINFVVEAGAGTGKTTLLIERLCFALLAQNITAPRLVALTFTEKAAAEITTRLIFQLQAVLQTVRGQKKELEKYVTTHRLDKTELKEILLKLLPKPQNERQKRTNEIVTTLEQYFEISIADILARGELALSQLDRSQIGTIHSFCADILRAFPLEAGLTPNAEIDKGTRAERIFDTEWNRFLDVELGENAPRAELWKEVLSKISLNDLYQCAQEMCSGKINRYNFFAQKDGLIKVCTTRAAEALELSQLTEKGQKKPRVIEQALQQASRRFTQAAQWLKTGVLPSETEETILIKSIPSDWDSASAERAKALCNFAAQADPFVQAWILKVYELLHDFNECVRAQYAQEGILSFDDLIIKTRDLLQNNLLVRRLVQEKYDVLYIDEFQDTDPAQGEILLYLAEQKGNGATHWRDVKLQPGKLFVVGDPKQSIYHFRGADITAYELFTDLILRQGGEKAYLRQNFRSEPGIIALANEVGEKIMQEKPAFQPAYEPIFTDKPAATVSTEMILISAPSVTALADDYRHNQAEQVANWIKQNVGKLKLKDGRLLTYKDIVILSRAATTLWPYTDALRRAGIAFAIEEDKDFYRRQEVSDFLNMLRVLQDPQDKISLVGVLRSPLGGLTDEEIYQAGKRGELDLRQTSSDEKLEWIFVQLRRLAARAGREPLRLLLREILQETFLAESCAVAYDGERSIENLQRLVTLAEGYSLSTPTTLGQFLTRVQELMEQELGRLTALPEGEGDDAVGVMTVHKSKGLEFPVVILVDISKKDTNNAATRDRHLYSWKYNLHGFRAGKYADINLAWLEEEEKEHSRCEEVRVLYVALTRAKEKLLLVGNRKAEDTSMAGMFARAGVFAPVQENPAQVGACGLAVRYINYVEPEKFIYKSAPHISQGKNQWDLSAWRGAYEKRAAQYAQYQQMPALLSPSALVENNTAENEEALQLGSWVHGALALKMQGTQDTMDDNLQFASTIYEQGHALLAAFYKSETWQKIAAWQSIGAEMPFSLKTAQGVVSGVMDLLARDEQGTVWVLDYKTDQVTPGTEKQAAQKYAPQLAVYLQAAQKLYPAARVQTAVVFVRTSTLIKL